MTSPTNNQVPPSTAEDRGHSPASVSPHYGEGSSRANTGGRDVTRDGNTHPYKWSGPSVETASTSPTKPSFRSNAHSLHGHSGIGLGAFLRNNEFRGNHMFDLSREGTSLFDGKDESEQSGRDQLRRMQMVAIGVRDIAGLDGFSPRPDEQVTVWHGYSSPKRNATRHPYESYPTSYVDIDSQLLPSVDNGEVA